MPSSRLSAARDAPEEWAVEPVGEVHQHQTHTRRLAARARGRQKQQRTAARKAAAAFGPMRPHAGRQRGQTGRTARRHPVQVSAAPMALRPRDRAASSRQQEHRSRGRPNSSSCDARSVEINSARGMHAPGVDFKINQHSIESSRRSKFRSKFSDGEIDSTGELPKRESPPTPNSRGNENHGSSRMRPSVSQGDPAQFIVAGSIGDQRVNILVDTGATISFITSALVPMLRPAILKTKSPRPRAPKVPSC